MSIRRGVILLAIGWGAAVSGQPAAPSPPAAPPLTQNPGPLTDEEFRLPLEPQAAAEIDRLVALLNSPEYKEREQATTSLVDMGAPAFAKLRAAYQDSDDLEARLRIEDIVRTAYLNRYVFDRNGFLGVSLQPIEPRELKTSRRVDFEAGVRITQVIANTGASRAGLKAEDIIVGFNGVPLAGTSREASDRFRETIRQLSPGTKIRLGVLREGNAMTLEPTIGRCPEDTARRGNVVFAPLYHQVRSRFDEWWDKYFDPQTEGAPSGRPCA